MITFNNEFFVREEKNGITVYEKASNLYTFYEGIDISKIANISSINELKKTLSSLSEHINRSIVFSKPFRVNWLIEEKCNLDCVYCFANDKMMSSETKDRIMATVKHILGLGVINVGISGGEPMLNPYIGDIIKAFDGRCSINIDTNGTIPSLRNIARKLKQANVLVRITIDAIDPVILDGLRPSKSPGLNQLQEICNNIKVLQEFEVPLMIHTVVTRRNIDHLACIAEKLIELNVKRWHMYGVNYSEKCKDIYDEIKVTNAELEKAYLGVKREYGADINMSVYFDEGNYSANSVILINSRGEFYLDSIQSGINYIGNNPAAPTLKEIEEALDIEKHCFGYLWVPNLP